ncbi:MAG: hypothetical protein CM15mP128_5000 [Methanobacteriota archaeon]|nr:MAG: hypothetical protein CM15mP128_5000 [Euryarchaeota archaeon]
MTLSGVASRALALGIGLAAASGFRVFIPPFLYGLATRFELNPTAFAGSDMQAWMASDVGLTVLGAAVVCELLAYYIPWLDNLLDAIASPAAVIGGMVLMSSSLGELDPVLRWSTSIIVGGTTSGTVQVSTVGIRALSTASTGGLATPSCPRSRLGLAWCARCWRSFFLCSPWCWSWPAWWWVAVGCASPEQNGRGWGCFGVHQPSGLKTVNCEKSIGGRQALTDASRLTVAKLKALCVLS